MRNVSKRENVYNPDVNLICVSRREVCVKETINSRKTASSGLTETYEKYTTKICYLLELIGFAIIIINVLNFIFFSRTN